MKLKHKKTPATRLHDAFGYTKYINFGSIEKI